MVIYLQIRTQYECFYRKKGTSTASANKQDQSTHPDVKRTVPNSLTDATPVKFDAEYTINKKDRDHSLP